MQNNRKLKGYVEINSNAKSILKGFLAKKILHMKKILHISPNVTKWRKIQNLIIHNFFELKELFRYFFLLLFISIIAQSHALVWSESNR